MNDLKLLSSEDLKDRIEKLLPTYSDKMKNLSILLKEIEVLYTEIGMISAELDKRKIEVNDSCLTETKKILETHHESSLD